MYQMFITSGIEVFYMSMSQCFVGTELNMVSRKEKMAKKSVYTRHATLRGFLCVCVFDLYLSFKEYFYFILLVCFFSCSG